SASEAEFLTVARLVRRTVRERFGRELKPEVRFISEASARSLVADTPAGTPPRANAVLLAVARWLCRAAVLLAALSLAGIARGIWNSSPEAGAVIAAGALMLLLGEAVYATIKYLERS
ncbi:MAG: hypothetical protein IJJ28_00025, partial [Lentisphaeria bacterium]|nr:hypothetical protein [Lentisphaeria bacterium]